MDNYINTPILIDSNSVDFLKTRKFPFGITPTTIEVSWVEEWTNKDGDKFDVAFTRLVEGYRNVKWDRATSFAFKLAGGFSSSLKIHKTWEMNRVKDYEAGDVFNRVVSVVISVIFS